VPAATFRVAIDFRPIATQVVFDPDWAIISDVSASKFFDAERVNVSKTLRRKRQHNFSKT